MSVVESICKHVAILDGGVVAEQGEVTEVFAHPKSLAAKKLVYPDGGDADTGSISGADGRIIRVVYNGAEATGSPVIARMAVQEGIEANIAYASTKSIGGKVYGSMLLSIDGDQDMIDRAIAYLTQDSDVTAEEVSANVQ
jgi:D-methionine transport system ATP-binding protein